MSIRALVLLVLSILPASALADGAGIPDLLRFLPVCRQSFRFDSYGRGIEAGVRGGDLRPKLNDERCYAMGVDRARQTLARTELSAARCRREFDRAFAEGLAASGNASGDLCYNDGYSAGFAALDVGAREGNASAVGASCVGEYRQGMSDGRAGRETDPKLDQKLAACYQAGYVDSGYLED